MAARLNLGHLSIESKNTGLELLLSSSASFTASEEDKIEDLQTGRTASQTSDLKQRPWFQSGGTIFFRISLQIKARLTTAEHDVLVETFSTQLQLASLWQQLHFSQPCVRTTSIDQARTLIEVTLIHNTQLTPRSSGSPHKLDFDVPFCDVKPPSGVPTASLEAVELDIKLHKEHRLHPDPSTKRHSVPSDTDLHEWIDDDVDDSGSETLLEAESYENRIFLIQPPELHSAFTDLELDSTSRKPPDETFPSCEMLNLLDAALRRTLSGSLGRLPHGVVMKCNKSFKTLSATAPSLFRQGHLPAIASRAVFLPNICRALAAVRFHGKVKAHMKMGLSNLPSQVEQAVSIEDDTLRDEKQATSEHLSKELWWTVEHGLLDSMRDTGLKPLSIGIDCSQDLLFEHELFDFAGIEHMVPHLPLGRRNGDELSENGSQEDFYSDSDDLFDDLERYEDEDETCDRHGLCSVRSSGWRHDNTLDGISQKAAMNLRPDESMNLSEMIGVDACMLEEDAKSMCESMGAMSMLDDYADACSSSAFGMDDQEMLLT